jgi:histidinol-phosphate phosphatase family protein
VVTNQPVIARGDCTTQQLLRIHDFLEMALGRKGAFIDRIYYCPHHPDKGFEGERPELKLDCECRKPGDGMIRQAVRELNLDLSSSWLIGDSTMDIQTARNCGVRAVLLRTGIGGSDQRYAAAPDYVFDDLLAAARFIVQQNTAANER